MTKINNQKINFKFESNNAFKERLKKLKKLLILLILNKKKK